MGAKSIWTEVQAMIRRGTDLKEIRNYLEHYFSPNEVSDYMDGVVKEFHQYYQEAHRQVRRALWQGHQRSLRQRYSPKPRNTREE